VNADWVAASVRARAMARRRVGTGTCRRIAGRSSIAEALQDLEGTGYADSLAAGGLEEAQRATADAVLWQLRVLAGWLPASGTRLVRAAAAGLERENILNLARHLDGGPERPEHALGALATAWPRLRGSTSREELDTALRHSPWGDPGEGSPPNLADVLRIAWLRELGAAAPRARPWAATAAALMAGRLVLVDASRPSLRLRRLARPLLGEAWAEAGDLEELRAALPVSLRSMFDGIDRPTDLWRAEVRAVNAVEEDAFGLLRTAMPGPSVVLGAIVVLSIDAWRVRAALAAAEAGGGSEVLDAVA
jgi:hypothetical protein